MEKLVSIATFGRAAEARLVRAHFQDAGLFSSLTGELTADFLGDLGALGQQVHLQVHSGDLKRALDLLYSLRQAGPLPEDLEVPADAEVWACDRCGEAVEIELGSCPYCDSPRPQS